MSVRKPKHFLFSLLVPQFSREKICEPGARTQPGHVSEVDVTPQFFCSISAHASFSWFLYSSSGQVPAFLHADCGSVLPQELYEGDGNALQGILNLWFQTFPGPGLSKKSCWGVSVGVYMFNPSELTNNFSTCSEVL